jgi:hypothetical protein
MPDTLHLTAANLSEILSDATEFQDPAFAQASESLLRLVKAGGTLMEKAAAASKAGVNLSGLMEDACDTAKAEKNERSKDLQKACDAVMALVSSSGMVAKDEVPAQFFACGDTVQEVLDELEFKDKKQIAELRKAAKSFYPTESALMKEAGAWSVRAAQVVAAIKAAAGKLNPKDTVQRVHLERMVKFAASLAAAAKVIKS